MTERADVAIVGAGILGLAHAYEFAKRGAKVVVMERGHQAMGASVRNFGMIWPIGQAPGEMRETALRSREIWLEVLEKSGIWHSKCGSLHLAYHDDELGVLEEFVSTAPRHGYRCSIVGPDEVAQKSAVVRRDGLIGAMWSPDELCVFPRQVVAELPKFLSTMGVDIRFGKVVTEVRSGSLIAGGEEIAADQTLICGGDDLDTLFPSNYAELGLVRTKLQMMRARPTRAGYEIGPHLCAGLTLGHYANFRICEKLPRLLDRLSRDWPDQTRWGIHLLVSQHADGMLTIGDSHEYGDSPSPFLREDIERSILAYLDTFLDVGELEIVERWHGVYAKHPSKGTLRAEPIPGVTLVTGVGGAGMTLSFGVAEGTVAALSAQTQRA